MCGLLYCKRPKKTGAKRAILKRYEKQRARGTEGFGYVAVQDDKIKCYVRKEHEYEIKNSIRDEDSNEILFHHRTPTSTPNIEIAAHPIWVENKMLKHRYYFIHNGVIHNEDELRKKHTGLGFTYTTDIVEEKIVTAGGVKKSEVLSLQFNDSESLAIEFALYNEGIKDSVEAEGSIAFICLEVDKKGNVVNLHYAHNSGSPLMLEQNDDMFFLRSQGGGSPVPEDKLYTINRKTNEVSEKDINLDTYIYSKKYHDNYSRDYLGSLDKDDDLEDIANEIKNVHNPLALPPATVTYEHTSTITASDRVKFDKMVENEVVKNPLHAELTEKIGVLRKDKIVLKQEHGILEADIFHDGDLTGAIEAQIQTIKEQIVKIEYKIVEYNIELIDIQDDAVASINAYYTETE